jgi:hypothetical protein
VVAHDAGGDATRPSCEEGDADAAFVEVHLEPAESAAALEEVWLHAPDIEGAAIVAREHHEGVAI